MNFVVTDRLELCIAIRYKALVIASISARKSNTNLTKVL